MTDAQKHAEALEAALARLPASLNSLGIHDFNTWTAFVNAANPGAIRSLLDERKNLREALTLIAETDPIDAALDPQRAVRVAKEALK